MYTIIRAIIRILENLLPENRMVVGAGSEWTERQWCKHIAEQWGIPENQLEVYTKSGMRCDIVDGDLAIEVDWAHKWPQSIGQSVAYAIELHKHPAVILLHDLSPGNQRHIERCRRVCDHLGIELILFEVDR